MKKFLKLGFLGLLLGAIVGTSSCYKKDIDDLDDRVTALEAKVSSIGDINELLKKVNSSFNSATYDEKTGKLTLTPVSGTPVVMQLLTSSSLPTYGLKLEGSTIQLTSGSDVINSVTLPTDKVYSADMFEVKDGSLWFDGKNTNIAIPTSSAVEGFDSSKFSIKFENGSMVYSYDGTVIGTSDLTVDVKDGYLTIAGEKTSIRTADAIYFQPEVGTPTSLTIVIGEQSTTIPLGASAAAGAKAIQNLDFIPYEFFNGEPVHQFMWIYGLNNATTPADNSYSSQAKSTADEKFLTRKTITTGLSSTEELHYRTNPTTALLANYDWSVINRDAKFFNTNGTRATGDKTDLISFTYRKNASSEKLTTPYILDTNDGDGAAFFYVIADKSKSLNYANVWNPVYDENNLGYDVDIFALRAKAKTGDKEETLSEYTQLLWEENRAYIGNSVTRANATTDLYTYDYPVDVIKAKNTPHSTADHYISYKSGTHNAPGVTQVWIDQKPVKAFKLTDYVFPTAWLSGYDWDNNSVVASACGTNDKTVDQGMNVDGDTRLDFSDNRLNFTEYEWRFFEVTYNGQEASSTDSDPNDHTNQAAYTRLAIYNETSKTETFEDGVVPTSGSTAGTATGYSKSGLFVINNVQYTNETAFLERTPMFRAELWKKDAGAGDRPLARHFIKFKITREANEAKLEIDLGNIPYLDLYKITTASAVNAKPGVPANHLIDGTAYTAAELQNMTADPGVAGTWTAADYVAKADLTWQMVNDQIYNVLPMSHDEFVTIYDVMNPVLTYDHTTTATNVASGLLPDRGFLVNSLNQQATGVGSVQLSIRIHPETRFGAHEWKVTINPKLAGYKPVVITYKFNLLKPIQPAFYTPQFVEQLSGIWTSTTNGKFLRRTPATSPADQWYMQATMWESFYGNATNMAINGATCNTKSFIDNVVNKIVPINAGLPTSPANNATMDKISGFQIHSFSFQKKSETSPWGLLYAARQRQVNKPTTMPASGNTAAIDPVASAEKDASQVVALADIQEGSNNVYNFSRQEIQLIDNTPITDDEWTYLVRFRSTYENMESMDINWEFRFLNPLSLTLTDFNMATATTPTIEGLISHLSGKHSARITSNNNPSTLDEVVLWNEGEGSGAAELVQLRLNRNKFGASVLGWNIVRKTVTTDYRFITPGTPGNTVPATLATDVPATITGTALYSPTIAKHLYWMHSGTNYAGENGGYVQVVIQGQYGSRTYAYRTSNVDQVTFSKNKQGDGGDITLRAYGANE